MEIAKMVGFYFPLLTIACAISLGAGEGGERQRADRNNKIIRMANSEKRKLVSDSEVLRLWASGPARMLPLLET